MLCLLTADNEMIERQVLYKTLQKSLGNRCRVFQVADGREALRIYEEEKMQTAILDIEVSGINGTEATQQIRQTDEDYCIIFLTAFNKSSYIKKTITIGALDCLLKSYDEQELVLVVKEAIYIVRERRQNEGDKDENENPATAGIEEPGDGGHARLSEITSLISQCIRENYMFDISVHDAARAVNYSEAYFCKLFKQCFSQNFTSYLIRHEIKEAKKTLKQPTVDIEEIGGAVGYGGSNYFAKMFKRITGQGPTGYRLSIFQKG